MQDIHPIGGGSGGGGGGGGRYFGGGDRRLRQHNHLNNQALKCPRCESPNTKFCYYNNYNLSQPRHFCKSCRRYWTKGGVLRNVPVGGGCRKTKRSRQKTTGDAAKERSSNVQSSSSESSSLAAATTATTPTSTAAVEEGSAPSNSTAIFNFSDARFVTANPSFDTPAPIVNRSTDGQIFSTDTFASLLTSPPQMMAAFSVADIPTVPFQRGNQTTVPENLAPASASEFKMQELNDEEGLAAALEWGSGGEGTNGGDQGLFDLTAAVDPAYWSQPQWTDSDNPSLNYLP